MGIFEFDFVCRTRIPSRCPVVLSMSKSLPSDEFLVFISFKHNSILFYFFD